MLLYEFISLFCQFLHWEKYMVFVTTITSDNYVVFLSPQGNIKYSKKFHIFFSV